MSRFQTIWDFVFGAFAFVSIPVAIITPLSLDNQFIPTIINGMTSSISLIIGFTATAITIMASQASFKAGRHRWRVSLTLILLVFCILMLFSTFASLGGANLERAYRFALIGLNLSVSLLMDFVSFLVNEILM